MYSHIMRWVVPLIAGLIVVGIFLLWVWGQMKDLPIVHEGTGEKARFMRYLSCAAAMCGAWHHTDTDACLSGEVISQALEFEGQTLVKGCRELCEDIREDHGLPISDRYCGKSFAFQFTFEDDVNFTSLDIRNLYSFRNRVIHKSCYECPGEVDPIIVIIGLVPTGHFKLVAPWGDWYSEGYLLRYTADECGVRPGSHEHYPGPIWISDSVEDKCSRPTPDGDVTSYAYCEFDAGDTVTIYAGPEPPHQEDYWEWEIFHNCGIVAWICDLIGRCTYNCPQIFVCE